MKTRSKQVDSTFKAPALALLVAFMLALFAMWSAAVYTAYAEETEKSIEVVAEEFSSDEYQSVATYSQSSEAAKVSFVVEGNTITIKASEDTTANKVVVKAGDATWVGDIEGGKLSSDTTYTITIKGDGVSVDEVTLYAEAPKDGDAANSEDPVEPSETPALREAPTAANDSTDATEQNTNGTESQNNEGEDGKKAAGDQTGNDSATPSENTPEDANNAADNKEANTEADSKECTVTFDSKGGSAVDSQKVEKGTKATKPQDDPTYEGYTFVNWYAEDAEEPFDFDNTPIDGDITLYAKWNEVVVVAEESTEVTKETTTETITYGEYSMSIGKTDSKTGATLSGAEFELRDSSGNVVLTWTTSANSAQLVSGLRTDTTYVLVETKAPNGYNREKDINIHYDANSNRVLIDQGGPSVALDNNSSGAAILNVRDIPGTSTAQASATSTPKTGDNLNLPLIIGVLVVVIVAAGALAIRARKGGKDA